MQGFPLDITPGKIVDIDGVGHVFERVDPDGRLTIPSLRNRVDFAVTDPQTGFPIKPNADDIARLMIEGRFVLRAPDLNVAARRVARKMELNAAAAKNMDPKAEFRVALLRAYDANPCSLSDRALREFTRDLLADPLIAALPGARVYAGSTLRQWINERGHDGDRRMRDGVSMTGRMPRNRRVRHPKEILTYWIAYACQKRSTARPNAKVQAFKVWEDYKGEINRINDGVPTGRADATYARPARPYKAVSSTTFWRMCHDALSSATLEAQHGAKAVYSRYGGGGRSERPKRVGSLAMMDDTPVPGFFLVDLENRLPLGQASMVLMPDAVSKCVLGWDLTWDEPSAATALRTYAHANTPKSIPSDLEALHPELKWICCKPAALLVDNLHGHHSRHFEDSILDAGTDPHYTGAEMARDKAEMEAIIGTILDLFIKDLPTATYDIPRAREFGFDPDTMVMVPLKTARDLLTRVICTYHLTPHKSLKKRQPALIFKQHAEAHGIPLIDDIDEFNRAIGNVEFDVQLRPSGIDVLGLHYSDYRATRDLVDDLVALQPPSQSRTKRISLKVKVKYSPDNIGEVHVWNTRTKRYVTLPCTDPDYAEGMPLWAHQRILDVARKEALAYSSTDELIEIRKRLFESIRNISPEAAEQDRRALAKLSDNPLFQRVIGRIVEVVDESRATPRDLPSHALFNDLAASHRDDATVPTPRAAPKRKHRNRDEKNPAEPASGKSDGSSANIDGNDDRRRHRAVSSNSNLSWGVSFD